MGAQEDIHDFIETKKDGASISEIAGSTGHTRATIAKYLELMKLQNKLKLREVGRSKLWTFAESGKKVLIAEDDEHIRRLIKTILVLDNYRLIEAKDGKEALEKVSDEMPDLIILDLMMPKIDGIEVCSQLKKNALTRKIPIIMLTAKREMKDKVVGITAGADDYLTKPFEPRELRERVKTFLESENRERNPVTNLPSFDYSFVKLRKMEKNTSAYYIFFRNLDLYKKIYGFLKANEVVRLTSQIITHNLERLSSNNFAGHDSGNNFIIWVESGRASSVLKEIKIEFDSTIPFFYESDYEEIDSKSNVLVKTDRKGVTSRIPILQLEIIQLKRDEFEIKEMLSAKFLRVVGAK